MKKKSNQKTQCKKKPLPYPTCAVEHCDRREGESAKNMHSKNVRQYSHITVEES
jgi:hypothetical protein